MRRSMLQVCDIVKLKRPLSSRDLSVVSYWYDCSDRNYYTVDDYYFRLF